MWVRAENGRLVNLGHVKYIEDQRLDTATPPGARELVARFAAGPDLVVLASGEQAGHVYQAIKESLEADEAFIDSASRSKRRP